MKILLLLLIIYIIFDYILDCMYLQNFKDIFDKLKFKDKEQRLYSFRYYIRRWLGFRK